MSQERGVERSSARRWRISSYLFTNVWEQFHIRKILGDPQKKAPGQPGSIDLASKMARLAEFEPTASASASAESASKFEQNRDSQIRVDPLNYSPF